MNRLQEEISLRLRLTYSRLGASKDPHFRFFLPVGANHAHAGQIFLGLRGKHGERGLNLSVQPMDMPAEIADGDGHEGTGSSTHKLSAGESQNIKKTASTMVAMVLALYMMPGPSTMRTAFRSFVARDISSPVRLRT